MTAAILPGTRLKRGRKVTAKERPVHDGFGAQMMAGTIRAWWAYEVDVWEVEEIDGTRTMLNFQAAANRAGVTPTTRQVCPVKASKAELVDMLRELVDSPANAIHRDMKARVMELVA